MESLHKIHPMLCEKIDEISRKGDLTDRDIEKLDHMTTIYKNALKIDMTEEGSEYSGDGMWNARGTYSRDSYYPMRSDYPGRRNSMGQYSRGRYSGANESRAKMEEEIDDMIGSNHLSSADKALLMQAKEVLNGGR